MTHLGNGPQCSAVEIEMNERKVERHLAVKICILYFHFFNKC